MEETERALREDKLLPDSVKCFVTTSRNKEGINILNKDFDSMYIESHNGSDIVQMAGRLRDGVNNLYIIVDSKSNWKEPWKYEGYFTKTMMTGNKRKKDKTEENDNCGALNEFLIKMFEKFKVENIYGNKNSIYTVHDYFYREISDYIDYAKEQFPCAQYNYFNNKFEYYSWRTRGIKYQRDNETAFEENLQNGTLKSLGKKWFPLAEVHEYITKEQQAKTILESFLNLYPNGEYPEYEVTVVLRDKLKELLNAKEKTINGVIKRITDGKFERSGQNIQRAKYRLYTFEHG